MKMSDVKIIKVEWFKYLVYNRTRVQFLNMKHWVMYGWLKWQHQVFDMIRLFRLKGNLYRTTMKPVILYGTEYC